MAPALPSSRLGCTSNKAISRHVAAPFHEPSTLLIPGSEQVLIPNRVATSRKASSPRTNSSFVTSCLPTCTPATSISPLLKTCSRTSPKRGKKSPHPGTDRFIIMQDTLPKLCPYELIAGITRLMRTLAQQDDWDAVVLLAPRYHNAVHELQIE